MVVDDGIDPSLQAFQGQIAGAFTIVCDANGEPPGADVGPDPDGEGAIDLEAMKKALIAGLATSDESSHLQPGIEAKTPFGATLEDRREQWNRTLRNDDDPFVSELAPIPDLFDEYLATADYHGTSTAATASFDVPELRLILVEQQLGTLDEAIAGVSCLRQEAVDAVVTLLSDPEVRQAYLAHPQPAIERELAALRSAENVGLVNESFGSMPRFALEKALLFGTCRPVELHAYFQVLRDLLWAYDGAHAEPGVLFLRSAGNNSAALNDGDDGLECRPGDVHQILVGAYGTAGKRSAFTNFGNCVDLYAPGEFVVAPVPGDWLSIVSGTSFSAPMALRRVLFAAPEPFSPATARAALLDERQPGGNLDVSLFRKEQVLDLREIARKRRSALTVGTSIETSSAVPSANRTARWPTSIIRRAVAPLLWAKSARWHGHR